MYSSPILVAYSEIGTKGNTTRARFEKLLLDNIKKLNAKFKVSRDLGRIVLYPHTADDYNILINKLKNVFGIQYYAPVKKVTFTSLKNLSDEIADLYCSYINGKTFRVTVHRTGKHDFTSIDAQKEIGARLVGCGGKVNLTKFDVEINVNIKDNEALVYDEYIKGPGGLPLGSEGKVLVLFSGGIDSPVAAWYVMRRGCKPAFLFVNLGGKDNLERVYAVYKKLTEDWVCTDALFLVADGKQIVEEISKKIKPSYRQVILKKAFYKIAERVCKDYNIDGVVTGESIGQVSSQTLKNLKAIEYNTNLLVLRPLIGMNKEDIIYKAREIGTYNFSIEVGELCNISKGSVKLSALPRDVEKEFSLIKESVEKVVVTQVTIDHLDLSPKNIPTKIIDLDKEDIDYSKLDPNTYYIITCKDGVKASLECDTLRNLGYKCISKKRSLL